VLLCLLPLSNGVAGAYEGLACASVVLLKHDTSALPVQRNASFSLRHELLTAMSTSLNTTALRSEFTDVQVLPLYCQFAV